MLSLPAARRYLLPCRLWAHNVGINSRGISSCSQSPGSAVPPATRTDPKGESKAGMLT